MSYSDSFPSSSPVFQSNFAANGGRIDPRMTFSRSDTPPTYAAPSAVHYWSNEKHLSSENLLKYSDDVSQSNWIKDGLSETGGQTAPDGGADAYKLTENTANDEHRIYQAASERITSSGSLTVSVHLKYIGRQWAVIRITDSTGTDRRVWFDIQNGTKGTEETNMTGSITASGNGYYKCVATISSVAASPGTYVMIAGADADNSYVYTGSGADAFAVWGIQASTTGQSVLNETSGQIHREYAPTLKSVATAGQPRFEYDPSTDGQSAGTSLGILVEGQSTNLITYSNNFSAWSGFQVTAEAGAAVGPDGQSCYVMREDSTAASNHYLSLGASGQSTSTTYTMSVYAKKVASSNQTRHLRLRVNGLGGQASVEYDLGNGTVNRTYGSSLNSQSISSIGNGWYRLVMTYTNGSGSVASGMIITGSPDTTANLPSYDGDGYSAFALFGAQVEEGSFASSLVSTSGSTATRAADSLSVATADIGYTGGPVTVVGETEGGQGSYPRAWTLSDGTANNRLVVYRNSAAASGSTDWYSYAVSDGLAQVSSTISSSADAGKIAVSYDTNDVSTCASGGTVTTDTSAVMPSGITTLYIGDDSYVGLQLNGHCKRVAIYNEALSDTNLQALTS